MFRTGRRRTIVLSIAAAAAVALVLLVARLLDGGADASTASTPSPGAISEGSSRADRSSPTTDGAAVWYDSAGLHRGDAVLQTAVPLDGSPQGIASHLALVRSGVLYADPETGDVWYQPWDGESRIVGRGSESGPAGDALSDLAAWFEASQLVVYDTAAGAEVTRLETVAADVRAGSDHHAGGNGFLRVSTDAVEWRSGTRVYRLDLRTGSVADLSDGLSREPFLRPGAQGVLATPTSLWDVHGATEVWSWGRPGVFGILGLRSSDPQPRALDDFESQAGRLSADGRYLLGVTTRHVAGVYDTATGQSFTLPEAPSGGQYWPWIAWSYGSTALVAVEREQGLGIDFLLACDVALRGCVNLEITGDVVLPAS